MSLSVSQDERRRATAASDLQEEALFGGVVGDETIPPVGTKADADAADQAASTRARARQVAYAQQRALQVPPAWVAVGGFLNSWANYGAPETDARFRRDAIGAVELGGAIAGGTTAVALVLPEGYRPGGTCRFIVFADGGAAQLLVNDAGELSVLGYVGGGGNTRVQLDGVRFYPAEL